MIAIHILFTPGCRSVDTAHARVCAAVQRLGISAKIEAVDMSDCNEHHCKFSGSPTVLINGEDLEPAVEPAPGAS